MVVVIELGPGDQGKRGQSCRKFRFVLLHQRERAGEEQSETGMKAWMRRGHVTDDENGNHGRLILRACCKSDFPADCIWFELSHFLHLIFTHRNISLYHPIFASCLSLFAQQSRSCADISSVLAYFQGVLERENSKPFCRAVISNASRVL